jgi:hypothetical protein
VQARLRILMLHPGFQDGCFNSSPKHRLLALRAVFGFKRNNAINEKVQNTLLSCHSGASIVAYHLGGQARALDRLVG